MKAMNPCLRYELSSEGWATYRAISRCLKNLEMAERDGQYDCQTEVRNLRQAKCTFGGVLLLVPIVLVLLVPSVHSFVARMVDGQEVIPAYFIFCILVIFGAPWIVGKLTSPVYKLYGDVLVDAKEQVQSVVDANPEFLDALATIEYWGDEKEITTGRIVELLS